MKCQEVTDKCIEHSLLILKIIVFYACYGFQYSDIYVIYLSIIYLFIYLFTYLLIYLFICLCIYLCIYLFGFIFISLTDMIFILLIN